MDPPDLGAIEDWSQGRLHRHRCLHIAQQYDGCRSMGLYRLDDVLEVAVGVTAEEDPAHDCRLSQAQRKASASTWAWCRRGWCSG
jgi:hypothetical protein